MSTNFSSSSKFCFNRSAIQPSIPTISPGCLFFLFLKSFKRSLTLCSAFSRIEQVFIRMMSASLSSLVVIIPSLERMEAITSESEKFIAQP